jgi:hypothetical protein
MLPQNNIFQYKNKQGPPFIYLYFLCLLFWQCTQSNILWESCYNIHPSRGRYCVFVLYWTLAVGSSTLFIKYAIHFPFYISFRLGFIRHSCLCACLFTLSPTSFTLRLFLSAISIYVFRISFLQLSTYYKYLYCLYSLIFVYLFLSLFNFGVRSSSCFLTALRNHSRLSVFWSCTWFSLSFKYTVLTVLIVLMFPYLFKEYFDYNRL